MRHDERRVFGIAALHRASRAGRGGRRGVRGAEAAHDHDEDRAIHALTHDDGQDRPRRTTSAPVMMSARFWIVKPMPAAAQPRKAVQSDATTGMSAPPIGMMIQEAQPQRQRRGPAEDDLAAGGDERDDDHQQQQPRSEVQLVLAGELQWRSASSAPEVWRMRSASRKVMAPMDSPSDIWMRA